MSFPAVLYQMTFSKLALFKLSRNEERISQEVVGFTEGIGRVGLQDTLSSRKERIWRGGVVKSDTAPGAAGGRSLMEDCKFHFFLHV